MNTVEKMAHWLQVGDVIVAPDRSQHTVTEIQHHGLAALHMSIRTDTGLLLNKSVDEAKLDWYDVLVQEAAVA